MAYRNKTYVCFDGDEDMHYYRLMTAWAANDRFDFDFYNVHDLNTARDSSLEESIKRQLRERFANSKVLVVLVGEKTQLLTKFVKWEMEVALRLELPIVAVNLNKSRQKDARCPPTIANELVMFVPWGVDIVQYAMKNWPDQASVFKAQGKTGTYHYTDETYRKLGL